MNTISRINFLMPQRSNPILISVPSSGIFSNFHSSYSDTSEEKNLSAHSIQMVYDPLCVNTLTPEKKGNPQSKILLKKILNKQTKSLIERSKVWNFLAKIENDPAFNLGQFIFIVDQDLNWLQKLINGPKRDYIKQLSLKCDEHIQKIQSDIYGYMQEQSHFQLQDPDICKSTMQNFEISKMLLTSVGEINESLIDYLIDNFTPKQHLARNHPLSCFTALCYLKNSTWLRSDFAAITAPHSSNKAMQYLIRIALHLDSQATIRDEHAKLFALSGFLCHFRQLSEESCFSNALIIHLLNAHPSFYAKDVKELIRTGYLTRKIKNSPFNFPFLIGTPSQDLDRVITLKENDYSLIEAPSFQTACQALGIKDFTKYFKRAVDNTLNNQTNCHVSVKNLLKALVMTLKPSEKDILPLFSIACAAFQSHTNHLLLQAWNNAVAGMAEASEDSMIKSALIKNLTAALRLPIRGLTANEEIAKEIFFSKIQEEFLQRIQYLYDPWIQKDVTGESSGFVLYDKSHQNNIFDWVRIDSALEFQNFLMRILKDIEKEIPLEKEKRKRLIQGFSEYINSQNFLNRLTNYYGTHMKELKKLPTPWVNKSGNDMSRVLKIYFSQPIEVSTKILEPNNAEELLDGLITISQFFPDASPIDENFSKRSLRLLIRVKELHAFSLMIEPFKKNNLNIKSLLIEGGNQLSELILSEDTKLQLLEQMSSWLKDPHLKEKFLSSSVLPSLRTYYEFRNHCIEELERLKDSVSLLAPSHQLVDELLLQYLALQHRPSLKKAVFHFADTNWRNGIHDVDFCFVFNPGTKNFEMWEVDDSTHYFKAVHQNFWFQNRSWQVFIPSAEIYQDQSEELSSRKSSWQLTKFLNQPKKEKTT